jgi:hypothetical protein
MPQQMRRSLKQVRRFRGSICAPKRESQWTETRGFDGWIEQTVKYNLLRFEFRSVSVIPDERRYDSDVLVYSAQFRRVCTGLICRSSAMVTKPHSGRLYFDDTIVYLSGRTTFR